MVADMYEVKVKCCRSLVSAPILVTSELLKPGNVVDIEWGSTTSLEVISGNDQNVSFSSVFSICRFLARTFSGSLYGKTNLEKTEVDHWLEYCGRRYTVSEFKDCIEKLNRTLSLVTYLVGDAITLADVCVWSMLHSNKQFLSLLSENTVPENLLRWYNFLTNQSCFRSLLDMFPNEFTQRSNEELKEKVKTEDRGKFTELPGAEIGNVIVRFPPEASGYLHIGHAKAALLNAHYQVSFQGKLIMRFDDTNPEKEKEDFEKVILEDVSMLEIKPDIFTYTSDHFDVFLEMCEYLLKCGFAYVDDTNPEMMKNEREQRTESKNRNNCFDKNWSMWEEMQKGTDYGKSCCVRAKIDMASDNGCLRDPTIYRCKSMSHPRTGSKYNVYPTYDFACPIVDSIEGVTHALRTTEYHDRDDQYFWILDVLKMRKPYIYEYSRLNMTNTMLSKRKLTWFVENGIVDGWDDPRMPTVRGVLRRGMTVEGLKQFIVAQGSSRSVVVMEWDKIWAFNKKVIDPVAPRYNAVEKDNYVTIVVEGATYDVLNVAKHPKNPDLGTKDLFVGPRLLIDRVDADMIKIGENVTFINWGNLLATDIKKNSLGEISSIVTKLNIDNKDYKKTLKVTWVLDHQEQPLIPCKCIYYDHLISKPVLGKDEDFKNFLSENTKIEVDMLGDSLLASLKKGDIIQVQRKGFFICDEPYDVTPLKYTSREGKLVLFSIPDGSKDMTSLPTVVRKIREKSCISEKEKILSLKGKAAEKSPKEEKKSICDDIDPSNVGISTCADDLNSQIQAQGDLIRNLKAVKSDKAKIDEQVQILLNLKKDFKNSTGKDWKPSTVDSKVVKNPPPSNKKTQATNVAGVPLAGNKEISDLDSKIRVQGNAVRELKSQKAEKSVIDGAVKKLLQLKEDFKKCSNADWKPDVVISTGISDSQEVQNMSQSASELNQQIKLQGDIVRKLKSEKAGKSEIDSNVKKLLQLKEEFKKYSNIDWKPDLVINTDIGDSQEIKNVSQSASELNQQIKLQGDTIRKLKSEKAGKSEIDSNVMKLLQLKEEFKKCSNIDWKPDLVINTDIGDSQEIKNVSQSASELNQQIKLQGDTIRKLKSEKAGKSEIDSNVMKLLQLKEEFKKCSNIDWKPDLVINTDIGDSQEIKNVSQSASELNQQIKLQGDTIRKLKSEKADKSEIDSNVMKLLQLKEEFKKCSNIDWKPDLVINTDIGDSQEIKNVSQSASELNQQIKLQGDTIRKLKSEKADKSEIDSNVMKLLQLKEEFKKFSNIDWKPDLVINTDIGDSREIKNVSQSASELNQQIKLQGDTVRKLKSEKAGKSEIDSNVKKLLKLKEDYKASAGVDWKPDAPSKGDAKNTNPSSKIDVKNTNSPLKGDAKILNPNSNKQKNPVDNKQANSKNDACEAEIKKITRLGLEVKKEENLAEWYSQVLTKAEMIEYYDISGCYILRPWSYSIWEAIQKFFDSSIKSLGVANCYFPMFVSSNALEKEKTHITDFAPEVAWVTKSGSSELDKAIAIRPTSETVMYPSYAKWIRSHRDLPLRLNQWCNVVRWEFRNPQPFIRTREFLWQEGHTAFATKEEAENEVFTILDFYAQVYENLLAIPVIRGKKTEKEKFAGADFTTTTEAYVAANGRGIQGATSHHLGQNFSKMFEIMYEDPETSEKQFVYQNSWGLSTRSIGAMVMIHGDNTGLVLPPRVAAHQVVIVPCGITASLKESDKDHVMDKCAELQSILEKANIAVKVDFRDNYSPGWKFNYWELKGVPIRIELGPKDIKKNQFVAVRRDTGEKVTLNMDSAPNSVLELLDSIHDNLFARAKKSRDDHLCITYDWSEFCSKLEKRFIILSPFCGGISCEENIKKDSAKTADENLEPGAPSMGAKSLCIPFEQPEEIKSSTKCIHPNCSEKPKYFTLFGRSY